MGPSDSPPPRARQEASVAGEQAAAGEQSAPKADEQDHGRLRTSVVVTIAVIGVAVLIVGGIIFVACDDQQSGLQTLAASSVVAGSLPRSIPLDYRAGHIVVDASFGDARETLPLILDTGAPTILSVELGERFGGEAAGSIVSASIDGEITTSPVVPFDSLELGGVEFRDVGAVAGFIMPGNPLYCISGHGLIGASLMKDTVWQIDYANEQLTIAASVDGLNHVDGAISLAFTPASEGSPSPVIEIPAGDGILHFLLDTGSDGWLTVNPTDLEGAGVAVGADSPAMATIGTGASGMFQTRLVWTALDIDVGGQALSDVPIATTTSLAEGQGNIGNAFLEHYVVTIDWPGSRLYLDPLTDDPRPVAPASATIGWDRGDYIVGSFVEDAAGTADLALGASVTAIDGVDVTSATFDDFCVRSTGDPAFHYEMTVDGDVPTTVDVAVVEDFFASLGG